MATNEKNIEERLKRLEAAMGDLKKPKAAAVSAEQKAATKSMKKASETFLKKPSLDSAKVFLNELETSSRRAPVGLAWTTITVTIVTIMSDDQGVISDRINR